MCHKYLHSSPDSNNLQNSCNYNDNNCRVFHLLTPQKLLILCWNVPINPSDTIILDPSIQYMLCEKLFQWLWLRWESCNFHHIWNCFFYKCLVVLGTWKVHWQTSKFFQTAMWRTSKHGLSNVCWKQGIFLTYYSLPLKLGIKWIFFRIIAFQP